MFFKVTIFFINNEVEKRLILGYYLYNSLCLIVTYYIMFRIQINIIDSISLKLICILLFLISFILAITYIDFISTHEIKLMKPNINSVLLLLTLFNLSLLFYILLNLTIPYSYMIYCDSTEDINDKTKETMIVSNNTNSVSIGSNNSNVYVNTPSTSKDVLKND
jgi:hypothetical protein